MQLVAVMVTYAAVAFGVLGSDLLSGKAWVRGLVPAPLWGLAAYLVILNALMVVRVDSTNRLETALVGNGGHSLEGRLWGSDAGDWVTSLHRQPRLLRPSSYLSILAAQAGVVTLSVYAVLTLPGVAERIIFGAVYATFMGVVSSGFAFTHGLGPFIGRSLADAMESVGKAKSAETGDELRDEPATAKALNSVMVCLEWPIRSANLAGESRTALDL